MSDRTSTKTRVSWSCTETLGLAITNPQPIAVLPISSEMNAEIEKKARAEGISPKEYWERAFAELDGEE
jgi:hypothetical protein